MKQGLTLCTGYTAQKEIQIMQELNLIEIDNQNKLNWIDSEYKDAKFIPYKHLIEKRTVYYVDGELFWE